MTDKLSEYAAAARTFLRQNRHGMLATISLSQAGFPFGSIVPYDLTTEGDIIIYVSLIAEHYKNLAADPRASLVAANYFAYEDPQAFARATVLCNFSRVTPQDLEPIQRSYEALFPNSVNHEIAHNFLFMRGVPERIRWIGGFGNIGWVSKERFREAKVDPLARAAFDIIQHMNEDHAETLKEYVKAFGNFSATEGILKMTEITSTSFTIMHHAHGEHRRFEIPFQTTVSTPDEARAVLIRLLKKLREGTLPPP